MKVLIRYSGEVAIKSTQVRKQFLSRLVKNIKDGFKRSDLDLKMSQEWSRLLLNLKTPKVRMFLMASMVSILLSC